MSSIFLPKDIFHYSPIELYSISDNIDNVLGRLYDIILKIKFEELPKSPVFLMEYFDTILKITGQVGKLTQYSINEIQEADKILSKKDTTSKKIMNLLNSLSSDKPVSKESFIYDMKLVISFYDVSIFYVLNKHGFLFKDKDTQFKVRVQITDLTGKKTIMVRSYCSNTIKFPGGSKKRLLDGSVEPDILAIQRELQEEIGIFQPISREYSKILSSLPIKNGIIEMFEKIGIPLLDDCIDIYNNHIETTYKFRVPDLTHISNLIRRNYYLIDNDITNIYVVEINTPDQKIFPQIIHYEYNSSKTSGKLVNTSRSMLLPILQKKLADVINVCEKQENIMVSRDILTSSNCILVYNERIRLLKELYNRKKKKEMLEFIDIRNPGTFSMSDDFEKIATAFKNTREEMYLFVRLFNCIYKKQLDEIGIVVIINCNVVRESPIHELVAEYRRMKNIEKNLIIG